MRCRRPWCGPGGALERFEGRSSLRTWLYRIATNVCIDMLRSVQRRARPMEMGPNRRHRARLGPMLPEATWVTPVPDSLVAPEHADPAQLAEYRESIRLAFVTALQHLPARQRAALILCDVLRWRAPRWPSSSTPRWPSVNSALQRAPSHPPGPAGRRTIPRPWIPTTRNYSSGYVDAFQRYDIEELVTLLHEDAVQSMPPFALWLRGSSAIGRWMVEPGPSACRDSRLVPSGANGCPAFGQYRRGPHRGLQPLGPPGTSRSLPGASRR